MINQLETTGLGELSANALRELLSRRASRCRSRRVTFVVDPSRLRQRQQFEETNPMKRSSERILTTHVGSLPRPPDLLAMVEARQQGKPIDEQAHARRLREAVGEVVRKQVELGVDVIDDGEFGKPSFVSYVNDRLGGFEIDKAAPRRSSWAESREARSFPEFYAEANVSARIDRKACKAPVTYRGMAQLQADIANLKSALDSLKPAEVFMPAISPTSAADWLYNGYYKTEEE